MNSRMSLALLIMLALLPWSGFTAYAQETDYLIVPEQRFGKWDLGKPLDVYGFGEPSRRLETRSDGVVWSDFLSFLLMPQNLALQVFTCKSDSLVFAIMGVRQIGRTEATEATKYKTSHGLGIGSEESEVIRALGQPSSNFDTRDITVGGAEVAVKVYDYPGLRVRVAQTDRRVHALGATTRGGFGGCQQAVLGAPLSQAILLVARDMGVPLPSNARMKPPGPAITPDRAAFFGGWAGRWSSGLPHILVVLELTFNPARVVGIYAWGPTGGSREGWSYVRGAFSGPDLVLERFGNGAQVTYRMNSDGTLSGLYEIPGFPATSIRMQRIRE